MPAPPPQVYQTITSRDQIILTDDQDAVTIIYNMAENGDFTDYREEVTLDFSSDSDDGAGRTEPEQVELARPMSRIGPISTKFISKEIMKKMAKIPRRAAKPSVVIAKPKQKLADSYPVRSSSRRQVCGFVGVVPVWLSRV